MNYKAKILINKRTKQLSIALSKKKLEDIKKKITKFIKVKEEEFEFDTLFAFGEIGEVKP